MTDRAGPGGPGGEGLPLADPSRPAGPDLTSTVEGLVRTQLAAALGGRRGVLEAAVPTVVFTLLWVTTRELELSVGLGVGAAVALLVLRLAQRQTVRFVLNSLLGILVGAVFALRSGRAEDAFLPGIVYNAVYGALLLTSVAVRWPVVGFLVGSVTGDPTAWREDPGVRRLCSRLTLVLAVPCVARVVVQYPIYLAGAAGWLGAAKLAMGWPLQVAALAVMAGILARGRTPLQPGEPRAA